MFASWGDSPLERCGKLGGVRVAGAEEIVPFSLTVSYKHTRQTHCKPTNHKLKTRRKMEEKEKEERTKVKLIDNHTLVMPHIPSHPPILPHPHTLTHTPGTEWENKVHNSPVTIP